MVDDAAFVLYFGGAEVPGWRALLKQAEVQGMALTYMNLRQRIPKKAAWKLSDHVPETISTLVESGAYTANKDPGRMDRDGWLAYDQAYIEFVHANLDSIGLVTEFDSMILGPDYIHQMREDIWSKVPQFMPVWHEQFGLPELERLATEYDHVSIPDSALRSGPRVAAKINTLTQRFGTKFHGAAVTKPDVLREVRFFSAHSTSWLSPIQYGDTIVWDGTRLRRYPKKYKDQARKRHRMLFSRAGFDAAKIADGDPTEVARFTIWSWQQMEAQVGRRRGERPFEAVEEEGGVTRPPEEEEDDFEDELDAAVARHPATVRQAPVARPERIHLPVFGFEESVSRTPVVTPEGEPTEAVQLLARSRSQSLRRCDNCFVSGSCPAFEPGNECAFDLPLEVRSKEQLSALLTGIIEMQAQRVAFARFAEELEGGYPDPNVSGEMDRLFKLVESLKEIQDTSDGFEVHVKAKAGAGVLSRLFGSERAAPLTALQRGYDEDETNDVIRGVVDAELVPGRVTRPNGTE